MKKGIYDSNDRFDIIHKTTRGAILELKIAWVKMFRNIEMNHPKNIIVKFYNKYLN